MASAEGRVNNFLTEPLVYQFDDKATLRSYYRLLSQDCTVRACSRSAPRVAQAPCIFEQIKNEHQSSVQRCLRQRCPDTFPRSGGNGQVVLHNSTRQAMIQRNMDQLREVQQQRQALKTRTMRQCQGRDRKLQTGTEDEWWRNDTIDNQLKQLENSIWDMIGVPPGETEGAQLGPRLSALTDTPGEEKEYSRESLSSVLQDLPSNEGSRL